MARWHQKKMCIFFALETTNLHTLHPRKLVGYCLPLFSGPHHHRCRFRPPREDYLDGVPQSLLMEVDGRTSRLERCTVHLERFAVFIDHSVPLCFGALLSHSREAFSDEFIKIPVGHHPRYVCGRVEGVNRGLLPAPSRIRQLTTRRVPVLAHWQRSAPNTMCWMSSEVCAKMKSDRKKKRKNWLI